MAKKIKKILIANRGEIALRVIETCRALGITSVTLFTEEERELPHAFESDEAYCLGNGTLAETYLNQNKIIEIAKNCQADAIHPGYGFLSENPDFAALVRKSKLIFIGPSSDAMKVMGDKKMSKETVEEIGGPLIPGYHGDDQSPATLKKEAKKIGYPVLIKASAGGGGKGMRVVESESQFEEALEAAKREAKNAFGNDQVLVEKFITNPRHIEVQVMSDQHGNHFHLFERECSIQRRHQKIVEETPSTALSDEQRKAITDSAVAISKHINYEGAGTVEFILDDKGKFYFLEMNTRLQVEHPITEMVTRHDLVRLQIEVAEGKKLSFAQNDVVQTGHAIEVRLYAEDPDNDFMPSIGKIQYVGYPTARDVRLDTGYTDGNDVTISFDPMLAKLIAWGETRESATNKILLALEEVPFLGLKTNRDYLKRILENKEFEKGNTYTHFVSTYADELKVREPSDEDKAIAIAANLFAKSKVGAVTSGSGNTSSAWDNLQGFRNI